MSDTTSVLSVAISDLEDRKKELDVTIPQLKKELKDRQEELDKISYALDKLKLAKDYKPAMKADK